LTQSPKEKVARAELGTETTDEELMQQFLDGDEAAFRTLYTRYVQILTRRMQRVFSQSADVEDAVQDAFTQVYRSAQRYESGRSVSAWIHGIAFRVAGTRIRTKKRKRWLVFGESTETDSSGAGSRIAGDKAEQLLLGKRLYAALAKLPEEVRVAFALREIEEMELKDIAEIFETSAQTIWARVESAKKKLRELLEVEEETKQGSPGSKG